MNVESFIEVIVLMLFASAIFSFLFYILAGISLIKTIKGENKKKIGLAFLALGMILAYMPLKHLLGISIKSRETLLLIVIDCIMIYEFIKH